MAMLPSSATTISQCQVRMVSPTITSSVTTSAVKVMATTWRNSSWRSRKDPYMIILPVVEWREG